MGGDSTIIYLSIIIYSSPLSNIESDVFGLPESVPCFSIFFKRRNKMNYSQNTTWLLYKNKESPWQKTEQNALLANIDNDSLSYYSDVYTLKTCAKIYPVIFTLPNATNRVYTTVWKYRVTLCCGFIYGTINRFMRID